MILACMSHNEFLVLLVTVSLLTSLLHFPWRRR